MWIPCSYRFMMPELAPDNLAPPIPAKWDSASLEDLPEDAKRLRNRALVNRAKFGAAVAQALAACDLADIVPDARPHTARLRTTLANLARPADTMAGDDPKGFSERVNAGMVGPLAAGAKAAEVLAARNPKGFFDTLKAAEAAAMQGGKAGAEAAAVSPSVDRQTPKAVALAVRILAKHGPKGAIVAGKAMRLTAQRLHALGSKGLSATQSNGLLQSVRMLATAAAVAMGIVPNAPAHHRHKPKPTPGPGPVPLTPSPIGFGMVLLAGAALWLFTRKPRKDL